MLLTFKHFLFKRRISNQCRNISKIIVKLTGRKLAAHIKGVEIRTVSSVNDFVKENFNFQGLGCLESII